MKKLFLCLIFFAVPLFAQMDTDSTRNLVPRTNHFGQVGTLGKFWRSAHLDSLFATYFPAGVLKSDSSTIPGYVTRTQVATDSTNRNALLALKVAKSDSSTMPGYVTRSQVLTDSTNRNALLALKVAKSDSSTMPGYVTRSQILTDSTNRNALIALRVAKSDSTISVITVTLDSAWTNLTDTVIVCLPRYAIQLDSIGVYQLSSTTASMVYKFLYATNARGSWTAIITSPATITSVTTETWQSTLNNRTLPANGALALCCTTTTTKPKVVAIAFYGKHLQSD